MPTITTPFTPLFVNPAYDSISLQSFYDVTFDLRGEGPGQPFTVSSTNTNGNIFLNFDYNDIPPSPGEPPIAFDITFQATIVPEPSSLVLAASGLLVILIFAWMRGLFIR